MSVDDAVIEIKKCAGTQFDTEIVDVFLDSTINEIISLTT
jgi:HD-GYP domain-containing protein (c-di-GMP phosphodiesterase class II)